MKTRAVVLDEDGTEFEIAKFIYSSRPCSTPELVGFLAVRLRLRGAENLVYER